MATPPNNDDLLGPCRAQPAMFHHHDCRRDSLMQLDGIDMTKKRRDLLDLPSDILILIADALTPASQSSARLTCRTFHRSVGLPEKPDQTDVCARTAIYRHMDERRDAAQGKHRCALCKSLYADTLFNRARILDPEFDFSNFTHLDPSIMAREEHEKGTAKLDMPSTRICSWHLNRFIFPPSAAQYPDAHFDQLVKSAADTATGSCPHSLQAEMAKHGWASSVEPVCMHCGKVVVCVCSVNPCNMCPCNCDSCGVRMVRCWWKLARSGYGPEAVREASFQVARRKWLEERAEAADDGVIDDDDESVDFRSNTTLECGAGRAVKCARDTSIRIAR